MNIPGIIIINKPPDLWITRCRVADHVQETFSVPVQPWRKCSCKTINTQLNHVAIIIKWELILRQRWRINWITIISVNCDCSHYSLQRPIQWPKLWETFRVETERPHKWPSRVKYNTRPRIFLAPYECTRRRRLLLLFYARPGYSLSPTCNCFCILASMPCIKEGPHETMASRKSTTPADQIQARICLEEVFWRK